MNAAPQLLLLGRDHQAYGELHSVVVTERVAAAISVGADADSPSLRFKGDTTVANEDALCVVTDCGRTGFAVADAHFGAESSHELIEQLRDRWMEHLPRNELELRQQVDSLGAPAHTESETAILVTVYDQASGLGFGVSVGDASLCVLGPASSAAPVNARDHEYLSAEGFVGLGRAFRFETAPGDIVLAFTDGVDECHYRNPATSVTVQHLADIASDLGDDPLMIVEEVVQLALAGVDGSPGGQDNIAIVAIAT